MDERVRRTQDRENLRNLITQWNANRLDLFELSEPNEELEFHGVMRFYFQDAGQKVATKCIRVSSTATAKVVIYTLIEKFRPDLKMLTFPDYALYEIHENGDERQLDDDEKPLLVQLNWHRDDREGRFLLRRMDEKTYMTPQHFEDSSNFKRKLSKREKKEKKKKEKLLRLKVAEETDKHGLAEKLYTEIPETSFTRSISNPEAVMRRRRQQKLGKKLQQFRSKDGGPDTGGTLKIYGESLCKDVPYKTLLLSVRDNASFVVKEMLDKYGLEKEDPVNYCLVQSISDGDSEYHGSGGASEYILDDDECPLAILMNHAPAKGSVMFHIRRRPADFQPRKRKKKPKPARADDGSYIAENGIVDRLPFFLELNPDGSEVVSSPPRRFVLHLNVTEVGSERGSSQGGQYLQLFGPNVQGHHCVVAHTEGIVTVTPCSRDAESYVDGQRIFETTILLHGAVVRFGKIHCFRFIDPLQDDRRRHDSTVRSTADVSDRQSTRDDLSLHPSFDNDGNVETISTSSQKDDRRSEKSDRSRDGRIATYETEPRRGRDPILPAVLEVWEEAEDAFLEYLVARLDPSDVHFKLAPTYTLYMTSRFRASTHYRPEVTPMERAHRLTAFLGTVATLIQHTIEERDMYAGYLAFWMANASELLHFLKQDRHLSAFCLDAQDILAEGVQAAFRFLVQCMQMELLDAMPAFLEDCDDLAEEEGTSGKVLGVLSATMALLRRCRVNAALTIQLFSQLFHFINMWLFNKVLTSSRPNYCTRLWGVRLKGRLTRVETWAEKQGLELAADCHLGRIAQVAHLLQSPKSSPDDLSAISSTCIKLNSLQLQALLERYQPVIGEPRIPRELIDNVVKVAENSADEMVRADGRDVRLEEDADLQLPFLLPEDGYSCDIVRGLPGGLQEFLHPLQQAGLCRVLVQPTSCGYWTVYMAESEHPWNRDEARTPGPMNPHGDSEPRGPGMNAEPEVAIMKLQKSNNGMGLSIVAAKGIGQDKLGIYIKSVVKGGAADQDGRLQAGDQLLRVDGHSLVGITQEKAAEILTRTGPVVVLEIAKQGALYHGLATLLSQPSPVMYRGAGYPGPRRLSERDIHSRFLREDAADPDPRTAPRMQSSKSVPSLNSGNSAGATSQELLPLWAGNAKSPQEVYNPAYTRTSPAAPVGRSGPDVPPHSEGSAMKSKSTNNLRQESGPQFGESGPRGRPLSQPNLHQEERHYQNISMYQQQPTAPNPSRSHPNFGQQEDRASQRVVRPPLQPQPSQRPPAAQMPPRDHQPVMMANSRPAPGWAHPPEEQQQQRALTGPVVPQHQYQQQHSSRLPEGYAYQTQGPAVENSRSPEPPRGGGNQTATMGRRVGPQDAWRNERDVLRQEAKMDEMREEVRRREERLQRERQLAEQQQHLMQNQQRWPDPRAETRNQQRPVPPYPSYAMRPTGAPPPTAPKPRPGQQSHLPPQRPPPPFSEGRVAHDGPGMAEEVHRNSPQPPPPPPPSTHPLFHQMQRVAPGQGPGLTPANGQLQNLRYAPNNFATRPQDQLERRILEPGQKSFVNQLEGVGSPLSPSPWEREEREKEKKRRLDDARRFRDKEIDDLENLGNQRTMKQEERLRTLRLEQEFQRRAEELKNDDDDDNEEDDDVMDRRGLLRMMQENLERSRMKRIERDSERMQAQDANRGDRRVQMMDQEEVNKGPVRRDQPISADEWLRKQQEVRSQRREQQAREATEEQQRSQQRERQQKMEEVQRKKDQERAAMRELKLAREAEERILREAQRRQEEDARAQRAFAQQQKHYYDGGYMTGSNNYHPQTASNRGPSENGPLSPPVPPERKASFDVMAGLDSAATATAVPSTKRVSFHDTKLEAFEAPELASPQNSQNLATFTAGNTPGVIGAQEVYRDPRHRIEASRSLTGHGRQPGPEKLSFREKMKMFALETGEDESPRDKMKISKAQREIETNLPPATASARS